MSLQFIAIPETVCQTVRTYLDPFITAETDLCFYGEGAAAHQIQAPNSIAWGCAKQQPEHLQLAKGCSLPQLKQQLQSLLRARPPEPVPLWNSWALDIIRKQLVHAHSSAIDLTDKEIALLGHFMAHPDQVVEKTPLLEAVWGYDEAIDTHTLETHIYRLRQKLEPTQPGANQGIATVADGYRWQH